jgi:hypothetical protein
MDLGSGIRKKPIPDPGSRGQKGTGSRIPVPDPQHCLDLVLPTPVFYYSVLLNVFNCMFESFLLELNGEGGLGPFYCLILFGTVNSKRDHAPSIPSSPWLQ